MTLKATPLNSAHRALGAKMVDFGGWDMPVNYGSQIEEHNAVRSDAGMFDVSHMCVVDVKGANTRTFLRGLLANNVDKLQAPGKALYSCMLNPEGGVIDDLIVYFLSEDWFRIVVNAGTADKDVAWMNGQNAATNSGVTSCSITVDTRCQPRGCSRPSSSVLYTPPISRIDRSAIPTSRGAEQRTEPAASPVNTTATNRLPKVV